ncbi:MAG TPA: HNH endonuclease signature motif containing protein [Planctomycetota bacterium]|nr:HNH endonuclease signature motif containing protein [Planctomycetota bacterium]
MFRRTPSSVVNKMLNLSFDRQHGGRAEPEVFLRLSTEPERFLRLYLTILEAARGLGLGEDQVPDYLGAWQGTRLLGQEELGEREVGLALRERQDEPATRQLREWFGDGPTERIVEQRVRLGQHRFASAVLLCFEHRCGFCGFSPEGLGASGLLIASHIKPWAACGSERERLDPTNGIAACPTHDRAFDAGLLTVNGGYRIHRARGLQARLADRVTESFFGAGVLGERLVWGAGQEGPRRVYLEYHREHVFERVG